MVPLVSVIVPVYNAKTYIKRTIHSILNQTYENIEILLIVDGAYDGSYEICKEFAENDARIKVLYQDNCGVSVARNRGIDIAKGEYIVFVDHDDELEEDLIQLALLEMNDDIDLVKYSVNIWDINASGDKRLRVQKYDNKNYVHIQLNEIYISIISMEMDMYVWDAMYRRDFLIRNKIKFDEKYKMGGEDLAFNTVLFSYINRFRTIDKVFYNHYNRDNQSTSLLENSNYFDTKIKHLELFKKTMMDRIGADDYAKLYTLFASRLIGSIFYKCNKSNVYKEWKDAVQGYDLVYSSVEWKYITSNGNCLLRRWPFIRIKLYKKRKYVVLTIIYRLYIRFC